MISNVKLLELCLSEFLSSLKHGRNGKLTVHQNATAVIRVTAFVEGEQCLRMIYIGKRVRGGQSIDLRWQKSHAAPLITSDSFVQK